MSTTTARHWIVRCASVIAVAIVTLLVIDRCSRRERPAPTPGSRAPTGESTDRADERPTVTEQDPAVAPGFDAAVREKSGTSDPIIDVSSAIARTRVVDDDGSPIPAVAVTILVDGGLWERSRTDAAGVFPLYEDPSAPFVVRATHPRFLTNELHCGSVDDLPPTIVLESGAQLMITVEGPLALEEDAADRAASDRLTGLLDAKNATGSRRQRIAFDRVDGGWRAIASGFSPEAYRFTLTGIGRGYFAERSLVLTLDGETHWIIPKPSLRSFEVRVVGDGRPVAGAAIEVRSPKGEPIDRARTDDRGAARLELTIPDFELTIEAPGFARTRLRGPEPPWAAWVIPLEPTAVVSIELRDASGRPVDEGTVSLTRDALVPHHRDPATTARLERGRAEFDAVEPGQYRVRWSNDGTSIALGEFRVEASMTERFALPPRIFIEGLVTRNGRADGPGRLRLQHGSDAFATSFDTNGRFSAELTRPGRYRVYATFGDRPRDPRASILPIGPIVRELSASGPVDFDFTTTDVVVHVFEPSGAPAVGVEGRLGVHPFVTDELGRAQLPHVEPGPTFLHLDPESHDHFGPSRPVEVDEHGTVEYRLRAARELHIRLRDGDGRPLPLENHGALYRIEERDPSRWQRLEQSRSDRVRWPVDAARKDRLVIETQDHAAQFVMVGERETIDLVLSPGHHLVVDLVDAGRSVADTVVVLRSRHDGEWPREGVARRTDRQGQVRFRVPTGEYELRWGVESVERSRTVEVEGDLRIEWSGH